MTDQHTDRTDQSGARAARELRGHVTWLDTFTPLALGVLAVASGIYTYLGVSGLLEQTGAMSIFAAVAYSVAVSVGIFVFWSYVMRILPAMTSAGGRIGLGLSMILGSLAIVAMSSWLNAAALAGSAAVEQHLAVTVQEYQAALERANGNAQAAQGLARDVARASDGFTALSQQEASGALSGVGGEGAVYRLLTQKADELSSLQFLIEEQSAGIDAAFTQGNEILSRMRSLIVASGAVEQRSVAFAEQSVRLAGVITDLRQMSVAPLVERAANDLAASVILPELDPTATIRDAQSATINSVLQALERRAETLALAAQDVQALPQPEETTYTPISTADAVIRYAGNFVPSWAGAIAIDLLPAVLVLILAVTQAAIREGESRGDPARAMTLDDLEAAIRALDRIEGARPAPSRPTPAPAPPRVDD